MPPKQTIANDSDSSDDGPPPLAHESSSDDDTVLKNKGKGASQTQPKTSSQPAASSKSQKIKLKPVEKEVSDSEGSDQEEPPSDQGKTQPCTGASTSTSSRTFEFTSLPAQIPSQSKPYSSASPPPNMPVILFSPPPSEPSKATATTSSPPSMTSESEAELVAELNRMENLKAATTPSPLDEDKISHRRGLPGEDASAKGEGGPTKSSPAPSVTPQPSAAPQPTAPVSPVTAPAPALSATEPKGLGLGLSTKSKTAAPPPAPAPAPAPAPPTTAPAAPTRANHVASEDADVSDAEFTSESSSDDDGPPGLCYQSSEESGDESKKNKAAKKPPPAPTPANIKTTGIKTGFLKSSGPPSATPSAPSASGSSNAPSSSAAALLKSHPLPTSPTPQSAAATSSATQIESEEESEGMPGLTDDEGSDGPPPGIYDASEDEGKSKVVLPRVAEKNKEEGPKKKKKKPVAKKKAAISSKSPAKGDGEDDRPPGLGHISESERGPNSEDSDVPGLVHSDGEAAKLAGLGSDSDEEEEEEEEGLGGTTKKVSVSKEEEEEGEEDDTPALVDASEDSSGEDDEKSTRQKGGEGQKAAPAAARSSSAVPNPSDAASVLAQRNEQLRKAKEEEKWKEAEQKKEEERKRRLEEQIREIERAKERKKEEEKRRQLREAKLEEDAKERERAKERKKEEDKRRMEEERQVRLQAEEFKRKEQEERERARREKGLSTSLDAESSNPVLCRCCFRPGHPFGSQTCDHSGTNYEIRGGDKRMVLTCTSKCSMSYHFPRCWKQLQSGLKEMVPPKEVDFKSKQLMPCFTLGCQGFLKQAFEVDGFDRSIHKIERYMVSKSLLESIKPNAPHVAPAPPVDKKEAKRREKEAKTLEAAKRQAMKATEPDLPGPSSSATTLSHAAGPSSSSAALNLDSLIDASSAAADGDGFFRPKKPKKVEAVVEIPDDSLLRPLVRDEQEAPQETKGGKKAKKKVKEKQLLDTGFTIGSSDAASNEPAPSSQQASSSSSASASASQAQQLPPGIQANAPTLVPTFVPTKKEASKAQDLLAEFPSLYAPPSLASSSSSSSSSLSLFALDRPSRGNNVVADGLHALRCSFQDGRNESNITRFLLLQFDSSIVIKGQREEKIVLESIREGFEGHGVVVNVRPFYELNAVAVEMKHQVDANSARTELEKIKVGGKRVKLLHLTDFPSDDRLLKAYAEINGVAPAASLSSSATAGTSAAAAATASSSSASTSSALGGMPEVLHFCVTNNENLAHYRNASNGFHLHQQYFKEIEKMVTREKSFLALFNQDMESIEGLWIAVSKQDGPDGVVQFAASDFGSNLSIRKERLMSEVKGLIDKAQVSFRLEGNEAQAVLKLLQDLAPPPVSPPAPPPAPPPARPPPVPAAFRFMQQRAQNPAAVPPVQQQPLPFVPPPSAVPAPGPSARAPSPQGSARAPSPQRATPPPLVAPSLPAAPAKPTPPPGPIPEGYCKLCGVNKCGFLNLLCKHAKIGPCHSCAPIASGLLEAAKAAQGEAYRGGDITATDYPKCGQCACGLPNKVAIKLYH